MELPLLLFRLVLFSALAVAQGYLFLRLREAIRATRWPAWTKRCGVLVLGLSMALGYVVNTVIVVQRLPWVDPPYLARIGLLYPIAIWNFGAAFSALLLAGLRSAGRLRRAAVRLWRRPDEPAASAAADVGRRRFLQAGVGGLAATPLVFAAYGAKAASRGTEVEEVPVPFGCPLRVVHLTDIHAGLYMTRKDLRRYAQLVRRLQPDLLALTGDYISTSMSFLPCLEELTGIPTPYGIFATLGNHEHWNGDPGTAAAFFRERGAILLDNEHRIIQTPHGPFAVAGIDDLVAGTPDVGAALRGLDPRLPTLLLSHRPEVFPEAAAARVNLTLAGHWHGGQIKVPVLGLDVSIAHLASRYPEGLYRRGDAHLYVSRGIGTTGPPIRLNAPPEVVLLHLT
jgi:predicted MPP superfamily phosphohydrolase